jgi:uncharacterized protein YjbI with pentapeptide repeats
MRPEREPVVVARGLLLLVIVLGTFLAGRAEAACTDAAAPGVKWRRCLLDGQDLSGVDLTKAELRDTSFKRADLGQARLDGVEAQRAKFVQANMAGASLVEANLTQADFTYADLQGATLRGASLRQARLYEAKLRGADLTGVILENADFLRADLSGALWIDGTTRCAEGSVGRCHPAPAAASTGSKVEG